MSLPILKLYKDLLRYGENLKYTDKGYFRRRIRKCFKQNKHLMDGAVIDSQFQVKWTEDLARSADTVKREFVQVKLSRHRMLAAALKLLYKKHINQYYTGCPLSLSINVNYASIRNKTNTDWCSMLNNYISIRYKSYKRFLDYSKVPTLHENDLQEQHVRGSGPGGQATNKTCNAVVLKHNPTGLVVRCHESRSLSQNRQIAREILLRKLDNLINGDDSLENQEFRLAKRDDIKKKQKKRKLAELKNAFKERENL